jgi:stage V sporulation protein D (sporulation-specific penicillin-binding protein)
MLIMIFAIQTIIVARYAWVQIVWSPELKKLAKEQWNHDIKISARRGEILDRNGATLAISGNAARVEAFSKKIDEAVKKNKTSREEIAAKLAPILNMSKDELLSRLNKKLPSGLPAQTITLARKIEKEQGDAVKELLLPGIIVSEDTKRYYPYDNLASQILGSTDIDGIGRSGLELHYEKDLAGIPGRFIGETDPNKRELPHESSEYNPPRNGNDLTLTIDQNIQFLVEKSLEQGLKQYKAKRISAIVMDPKTGEILAMANKPDFDPNNPIKGNANQSMELWSNRMVNESFEPGSILKVMTAAASIEENQVKSTDTFPCYGSYKVAGVTIRCWKPEGHGIQTFAQILQNSCNVGFMMLGEKLGKETLHKYFDAFGFSKKTGIDYPSEAKGLLRPVEKVGPVELATESFGQGISITGIQYMAALGAIANDGKMIEPHLVKKITYTDDEGNTSVVKEVEPKVVKQVVSVATARRLNEIMESVVTVGAAKQTYIEGYHIGGKTGTAQKAEKGSYVDGKFVSSLATIAPANNPRLVMLVSLDEPDPSNYFSGPTAGPITKQIYEDIFRYLSMQPDYTNSPNVPSAKVVIPELRGTNLEAAKAEFKKSNLNFEINGFGTIVYDMSPKPGTSVDEKTKVTLYMGNGKVNNKTVVVPDFTSMTRKEASDMASSLGLRVEFSGDGIVIGQNITPRTEVDKNTLLNIVLEQSGQ